MEKLKKYLSKTYLTRLAIAVIGIGIIALATSIFVLTNLGTDPYQVLCNAIHVRLLVTQGIANMIMNGLIILFILIFFRKYINIAMFLSLFLSGVFIDLFIRLLETFINESLSFYFRIALAFFACILLGLGVYLYTSPKLGASPADSLGLIISDLVKQPYSRVRIFTDITYALLGFILGGRVGITSILSVLLTGPAIGFFGKLLKKSKLMRYIENENIY